MSRTTGLIGSTEIEPNIDIDPIYRTVTTFPDAEDPMQVDMNGIAFFPYDGAGNVVLRFWADITDGALDKTVEVWIYERGRRVPNNQTPTIHTDAKDAAAELIAKLKQTFGGLVCVGANPVTRTSEGTSWVSAHLAEEVSAGQYVRSDNLVQIMNGTVDTGDADTPVGDGASATITIGRLMGSGIAVVVKEASMPSGMDTLLIEAVRQS